jgi:hypothetical protein
MNQAYERRHTLDTIRKVLLVCGILSSLLYVGTVVLAAARWKEYSSTSQTVSELFAIDAPTSPLVVPLFVTYALLIYAFGAGVWLSAGERWALRFTAVGLAAKEVLGAVVTLFFPMHLRGVQVTLTDTMHATLTAVGSLFILVAMGFGAAALGRRFRLYSIATMLVLVTCGVAAGMDAPRVVADLPTPWVGVMERVNIGVFLLWVVVLAVVLLRAVKAESPVDGGDA